MAMFRVGDHHIALHCSFSALVAAEEELGSLFELVERAAQGRLQLSEIATLFYHLSPGRGDSITRAMIGEAIVENGLAKVTPVLRSVLAEILQGRG